MRAFVDTSDACNVQWMTKLDELFVANFGLGIDDLPDFNYTAEYLDGATPEETLDAWLEEYGEEFGL